MRKELSIKKERNEDEAESILQQRREKEEENDHLFLFTHSFKKVNEEGKERLKSEFEINKWKNELKRNMKNYKK